MLHLPGPLRHSLRIHPSNLAPEFQHRLRRLFAPETCRKFRSDISTPERKKRSPAKPWLKAVAIWRTSELSKNPIAGPRFLLNGIVDQEAAIVAFPHDSKLLNSRKVALCKPRNALLSQRKIAPAVAVKEELRTKRGAVRLAAAKENSGLRNRPFTARAAEAMASQNATTRVLQTAVWFAWVRAGSGQNFITDHNRRAEALTDLAREPFHTERDLCVVSSVSTVQTRRPSSPSTPMFGVFGSTSGNPSTNPMTIADYVAQSLALAKKLADKEIAKYGRRCTEACKDWVEVP